MWIAKKRHISHDLAYHSKSPAQLQWTNGPMRLSECHFGQEKFSPCRSTQRKSQSQTERVYHSWLKLCREHQYNQELRFVAIFIVIVQRSTLTRVTRGALSSLCHGGHIGWSILCFVQAWATCSLIIPKSIDCTFPWRSTVGRILQFHLYGAAPRLHHNLSRAPKTFITMREHSLLSTDCLLSQLMLTLEMTEYLSVSQTYGLCPALSWGQIQSARTWLLVQQFACPYYKPRCLTSSAVLKLYQTKFYLQLEQIWTVVVLLCLLQVRLLEWKWASVVLTSQPHRHAHKQHQHSEILKTCEAYHTFCEWLYQASKYHQPWSVVRLQDKILEISRMFAGAGSVWRSCLFWG